MSDLTGGMIYALGEIDAGRPQFPRKYHVKALVERDLAWWPSGREFDGDPQLTEKGRRRLEEER